MRPTGLRAGLCSNAEVTKESTGEDCDLAGKVRKAATRGDAEASTPSAIHYQRCSGVSAWAPAGGEVCIRLSDERLGKTACRDARGPGFYLSPAAASPSRWDGAQGCFGFVPRCGFAFAMGRSSGLFWVCPPLRLRLRDGTELRAVRREQSRPGSEATENIVAVA